MARVDFITGYLTALVGCVLAYLLLAWLGYVTLSWADTKCVGPFESPTCNYVRCMEGECK